MRQKLFIAAVLGLAAAIALLGWRITHEAPKTNLKEVLPITHYRLSNGLRVVVVENHRTPAISHMLFVRVGGADDAPTKSGLAHYVEHLMFKGTKTVSGEEYDRRIAAMGGENNAYTTSDYTMYYVTAPSENLHEVMALESDRLLNLAFDDKEALTERSVVEEERRMRYENSPSAILSEQMDAVQYLVHPYRTPVIGWEHDIKTLTPKDVRHFFATQYVASNMVLVVTGDVTPKEVRRAAMKYYGALPKRSVPVRAWATEPPSRTERAVTLRDERVSERQLIRQYTVASLGADALEEVMALELASQWLGGGRTGALYRTLVDEQQLAVSVSAHYDNAKQGAGQFALYAIAREGVTLAMLEKALDKALAEALARPPEAEDLVRAKTLLKADIVYAQDGLIPIASYVGMLMMLGKDEQVLYALVDTANQVTAEAMQNAVRRALVKERSVTGKLLPKRKESL